MTLTESAEKSPNQNWLALTDPHLPPEVKLWQIGLNAAKAQADLLSPDERERASRFKFDVHRERFIAGRAALRILLGHELDRAPEELQFRYSSFGKPEIEGLHFNLAHSEDLALLAIAPFPVGADIEFPRPVEFDLLARTVFSPAELELWDRMPADTKPATFYALWTRKEALLKGIGCGISEHVKKVSTFFSNSARAMVPRELDPEPWTVRSLAPVNGFAAAVAYQTA